MLKLLGSFLRVLCRPLPLEQQMIGDVVSNTQPIDFPAYLIASSFAYFLLFVLSTANVCIQYARVVASHASSQHSYIHDCCVMSN
jgi:hypothetical protein